jgi:hypothetical protein
VAVIFQPFSAPLANCDIAVIALNEYRFGDLIPVFGAGESISKRAAAARGTTPRIENQHNFPNI